MQLESLTTLDKGLCSIEIGPEGLAVAYTSTLAKREISVCEFIPYQIGHQLDNAKIQKYLAGFVAEHGLKKIPCNWVLHPNNYRLTLVDAPNVPQSEYKQAIRWQIKDIVSYSLEDMAIDIFYPDEPDKSLKKIYVIAAQHTYLQATATLIQESGLIPVAIDIQEFAIRNLLANTPNKEESLGFLSITNDSCLVVLIKQNNIQFVRKIPTNPNNLRTGNHDDLLSEIRRSFSYCQTELKQTIPDKFFIHSQENLEDSVIKKMAQSLDKNIDRFNLRSIIDFKIPINNLTESRCWSVIGGVLREEF